MTHLLTPPPDAIFAPTGPTWLHEDGIIITINDSAEHTLKDAVENMKITKAIGKGIPRPMLVDVTRVRSMDREARAQYVKPESLQIVTAVALVTNSTIGTMVGNLFINLNKHVVPIKLFSDPDKAKEWLLQFRKDNGNIK